MGDVYDKQVGKRILTKPYPFEALSFFERITTASSISPNWAKYVRNVSSFVPYGIFPTKSFVYVVSFFGPLLIIQTG